MMKVDKALQEVWGWKDEIYKENRGESFRELVKFIHREAGILKKENRLKLRQKIAQ